jgi:serine/threonine protein kinase
MESEGESMTTDFRDLHFLEKLGEGGMAEIHVALGWSGPEQPCLVAVKRLRRDLSDDQSMVRMFLKEAWLGRRLRHPNVPRVYDYGQRSGIPFIVMEYLDGTDLRGLLQERSLTPPDVVDIGCSIARALAYLHAAARPDGRPLGLVHRDVSLSNVLVTREGEVKLLDLGIAKTPEMGDATLEGQLKGSFAYMAPEQLAGGPVDQRADQFSLGVVMYELLTGERLFPRCDRPLHHLIAERWQKVSDKPLVAVGVPASLRRFVMRLLSPKRRDRFASMERVACELEEHRMRREPTARLGALVAESRRKVNRVF